MTIAYVAGATNTGGPTCTINKPAGTVSGHVMYAEFLQDATSAGQGTTLAGWTPVDSVRNTPSNGFPTTLLRKVAGGSEPTSYVFVVNGGSVSEGVIWTYSGVDNTTPEDAAVTAATGTAASIAYPSITVVTSGAVHIAASANFNALASTPSGYAGRTSGAAWTTGADKSVSGTVSGITSTGGGEWVARSVLLRPASSGGSSGTVSVTNANDTSSASGTTTVTGTLAKTNTNDTSAASGKTTILGTLAKTNANDTSTASGSPVSNGFLAITNANDSVVATGSIGSTSGTLAYTNVNDSAVASGTTTAKGLSATTNANDGVLASGIAGAVTGTVAYTNADDTTAAIGAGSNAAVSGGGNLWLGAYNFVHQHKKKYLHGDEEQQALQPDLQELVEPVIERKTLSLKRVKYSELGQAARYLENLKTQQSEEAQSAIDLIETRQLLLKVQAAELQAIQQQEDDDEEEAIFLLMH